MKKSYSKVKEREQLDASKTVYDPAQPEDNEPTSLELHPDRQAMLENPNPDRPRFIERDQHPPQRKDQRLKPQPFKKEAQRAQQRREDREAHQKEMERIHRERQAKLEERERFHKAMAKARAGGRNGQRKLGRESKVLLERVQKLVRE